MAILATAIVLRFVLGLVFSVSALYKLASFRQSEQSVEAYQLGLKSLARPLTWALISAELIVGPSLVFGWNVPWIASAAAVMLLIFIGISISALVRKLNVTCSCFGMLYREPISSQTILRDCLLLLIALFLLFKGSAGLLFSPANPLTALVVLESAVIVIFILLMALLVSRLLLRKLSVRREENTLKRAQVQFEQRVG